MTMPSRSKPADQRKSAIVNVLMTEADRDLVRRVAEHEGRTMSSLLLRLAKEKAARCGLAA